MNAARTHTTTSTNCGFRFNGTAYDEVLRYDAEMRVITTLGCALQSRHVDAPIIPAPLPARSAAHSVQLVTSESTSAVRCALLATGRLLSAPEVTGRWLPSCAVIPAYSGSA
jgi:hypothetical protein